MHKQYQSAIRNESNEIFYTTIYAYTTISKAGKRIAWCDDVIWFLSHSHSLKCNKKVLKIKWARERESENKNRSNKKEVSQME